MLKSGKNRGSRLNLKNNLKLESGVINMNNPIKKELFRIQLYYKMEEYYHYSASRVFYDNGTTSVIKGEYNVGD